MFSYGTKICNSLPLSFRQTECYAFKNASEILLFSIAFEMLLDFYAVNFICICVFFGNFCFQVSRHSLSVSLATP